MLWLGHRGCWKWLANLRACFRKVIVVVIFYWWRRFRRRLRCRLNHWLGCWLFSLLLWGGHYLIIDFFVKFFLRLPRWGYFERLLLNWLLVGGLSGRSKFGASSFRWFLSQSAEVVKGLRNFMFHLVFSSVGPETLVLVLRTHSSQLAEVLSWVDHALGLMGRHLLC